MVRIPLNQMRELAQAVLACSLVVAPLTYVFEIKSDEGNARLAMMENRKPLVRRAKMIDDLNAQRRALAFVEGEPEPVLVHANANTPIAMKERNVSVFFSAKRGCWRFIPTRPQELDSALLDRKPPAEPRRLDLAEASQTMY